MIGAIIIIWVICGILAYGITFGYFQRKFPLLAKRSYMEDAGFATIIGIFGVVGLLLSVCLSGFCRYGLKFR